MQFKLEQLEYQQKAIKSIIDVFAGQERNTFDSSLNWEIRSNILSLAKEEIQDNIKKVIAENDITQDVASLSYSNDLCIEMETSNSGKKDYYSQIENMEYLIGNKPKKHIPPR